MEKSLSEFIEHVYEAALDDAALARLPQELAVLAGGVSATIQFYRPDGSCELLSFDHFDAKLREEYLTTYASEDPFSIACFKHTSDSIRSMDRYLTVAEVENTRIFNEFCRPNRIDILHVVGTAFPFDGGLGTVAVHRGRRGGAFGVDAEDKLQKCLPHIKQLMRLRQRLAEANRRARNASAMFDCISQGVIQTDSEGRFLYANGAANSLLKRGDGVTFSMGNRVAAELPADAKKLRALIHKSALYSESGALLLRRSSGEVALQVVVAPFRPEGGAAIDAALLLVHDPARHTRDLIPVIMQMFGLSEGEAKVAVALTKGMGLLDISAESGLSANTIKTQLKRAMEKTDTRKQSALVGLIAGVPMQRDHPK